VIYSRLHEEAGARHLRAKERADASHAKEMQELWNSPPKKRPSSTVDDNQIVFNRLHSDHERKRMVRRELRDARDKEEITAMEWLSVHRDAQTKGEAEAVFDRLYVERPKRYYAWTDNSSVDSFDVDDPWISHQAQKHANFLFDQLG